MPLVPSSVTPSQISGVPGQRPSSQEGHNNNNNSGSNNNNSNSNAATGSNRQQPPSKDIIPQFDGAGDLHDGNEDEVEVVGDKDKDKERIEDTEEDQESQGPESKRTRSEAPIMAPNSVIINGNTGPAPIIRTVLTANPTIIGGGDELGSDLDDEEEGDEAADDENINDLVLCQYEKISRVRTRWRGVLRSGIVHINNRDYCFSKANMDFEW